MIELQSIYKTYQRGNAPIHALQGISLQVKQGEFVAIMGPSGSGKSSLLNILGALDQPSSGEYILDGINLAQLDDDAASQIRNQKIGFIFQSFHLLPRLTVLENVLLPQRYASTPKGDLSQRAHQLLDRLGLAERKTHTPNELSGGQIQRVAIARALLNEPALLLADEPTGNLDSKSAAEVIRLLNEVHAEGQTIILVTHDIDIAHCAQRVIHISDGQIIEKEYA